MKSPRRRSRLAKTARTAALVGAPLLLAESELHADIVHVSTPQVFSQSTYWTFNAGGFTWSNGILNYGGQPAISHVSGGLSFAAPTFGGSATTFVSGATIGSGQTFHDFAKFPVTSSNTYYGFKFTSSGTHYGWAQISTSNAPMLTLTIQQFAFNTVAGSPIAAGQTTAVPEPADFALGLGALAMGAAAVIRRRQKEKVAIAA